MASSDSGTGGDSSNSNTSTGGDTGGSSGNGGAGTGGSGSASVGDLAGAMEKFKDKGAPDLKLSPEARTAAVNLIKEYREFLEGQSKVAHQVGNIPGNVGTLGSAQQTKKNLVNDMSGPAGAQEVVDKCIDYLDNLEAAVGKAATTLMNAG